MNAVVESHPDALSGLQQVLTFTLGNESFGVEILRVQEIRGWSRVTQIPEAPPHVLGVQNLRGSLVPIVDLRTRLGLERVEYTPLTVIVVLSVEDSGNGHRDIGIVVDSVSDVSDLRQDDLKAAPDLGTGTNTEFIRALATIGDRMVMLLDADRLLAAQLQVRVPALESDS
ncbi:MAG TPA: chemotaxis protein CheW [Steroidobacteraceae bacterium]